jgi:3,4-dihydroxy 2-butanone 4-phosphate synthase/GTP cyclohydrolase II
LSTESTAAAAAPRRDHLRVAPASEAPFVSVEAAIEQLREGRFVVVVDDRSRENEGDLTIAAEFATPDAVNFMARYGRGLICLALDGRRCDELGLPPMATKNTAPLGTAFTVSIEARHGVTTGISAADRSHTIRVAADPARGRADLVQPGHVFPLRARSDGVLERPGHTEAAVDLMRLAGLEPAGVICEIMNDDGTMARVPDLAGFCATHRLSMLAIDDLVAHRRAAPLERTAPTALPTTHGDFEMTVFTDPGTGLEHVALVQGDVGGDDDVLVRLHSACMTGDLFASTRCDCGEQLELAFERIALEGRGVLVYLAQEGRGIGLKSKLAAYRLQDQGLDTVEANLHLGFAPDLREWGMAAAILGQLGVRSVRLLTNNPDKIEGLLEHGIGVAAESLEVPARPQNRQYLTTKRDRLGHRLRDLNSRTSLVPDQSRIRDAEGQL